MTDASPYAEGRLLTYLLITNPAYVSLHTGAPSGNEVSGNNYARQLMEFSNSGSAPTVASNTNVEEFPVATGAWGTLTHFALWDAVSGGNMLVSKALTASKVIAN